MRSSNLRDARRAGPVHHTRQRVKARSEEHEFDSQWHALNTTISALNVRARQAAKMPMLRTATRRQPIGT